MKALVVGLATATALVATAVPASAYTAHQVTHVDRIGDTAAFHGATAATRRAADIRSVTFRATSTRLAVTVHSRDISPASYLYDTEPDIGLYGRGGHLINVIDVQYSDSGAGIPGQTWTTNMQHRHVCANGVRVTKSASADTLTVSIAKTCLPRRAVKMKALVLFGATDAHDNGQAADTIAPRTFFWFR